MLSGLIAAWLVIRGGEYLIDYLVGDKNGKMTGPVSSVGLSLVYTALLVTVVSLIFLRILVVSGILQWGRHYALASSQKLSNVPDRTLRLAIFIVAILLFGIQSYAFPLSPGRDYTSYLAYYFEFFDSAPVYHFMMLYRVPIAPFILGLSLQYGGAWFLETLMALGYGLSIVAMYQIGLLWNRAIALGAALLLLCYPSYALLYHQASSEAPFALGFLLWCSYIVKTATSPSAKKFFIQGFLVFLLALTRPIGQLGILFGIFPFLLPAIPMRKKLAFSAAFLTPCVLLLMSWSLYNSIRYEDFTISRGSKGIVLFSRLLVRDKLIAPENGKYAQELRQAILDDDLLSKDPYKSYGITLDQIFTSQHNSRMFADLVTLSDRAWGWETDYQKLRDVAIEAIKKYPLVFLKNMLHDYYLAFQSHLTAKAPKQEDFRFFYIIIPKELNEKGLPKPGGQEEIPRSYMAYPFSSPDKRMTPDPNSIELRFAPEQQKKFDALHFKIRHAVPLLPIREGNEQFAALWNTLSTWFPNMFYWAIFNIVSCIVWRGNRRSVIIFFLFITFACVGATYLAAAHGPTPHFRAPYDPIFLMGGWVALVKLIMYGIRLVETEKFS